MPFFTFDDPRIRYTGRFAPYDQSMAATAPGSRFSFSYTGRMAMLQFDMTLLQAPVPHLYIKVDNGARVEVPMDRFLRVCADSDGRHVVEVMLKSMVEMFPRWNRPLTNRLGFEGVEAEALVELPRPRRKQKTIEFVGDSITEGVLVDVDRRQYANNIYDRVTQDDVTATYAWLLAEKLELTPLIMGYGAVGATTSGCGGVPKAADAYPYCFEGAPVTYPHPDYVFINHGSNDWRADSVTFTAGYVALLDAIVAAHPRAQVIAMSPFVGTHEADIEKLVAEYNERHGKNILFVNGSHWLPAEPLHPLRDGHCLAAEKLAEVLKDKLGL